jgi:predicted AAA+ superfamily ATPase
MEFSKTELLAILHEFNPWWSGRPIPDLPTWERKAVQQVRAWARDHTLTRMLLLSGARQTGKTTIFRQSIGHLLKEGIAPTDIFYVTFDHGSHFGQA